MRVINRSGFALGYADDGSIGIDLPAQHGGFVPAFGRCEFSTGVSIELPSGHGALVQPRSGLNFRHWIVAATGVIDTSYRGEVKVMLYNFGGYGHEVKPGDRIAQLVVFPVAHVSIEEVESLSETERGVSGFGSSGMGQR